MPEAPQAARASALSVPRLYSTLSRRKEELPPPPGPIRMYVCGPTVYQRIHVGNARPFVISLWVRRWLRERGYDVKLVENITDVNDKIYDAAPGSERRARRRRDRRGTSRTRMRSASAGPTSSRGDRVDRRHRGADRAADRARPGVRGRGGRLLPRRARSGATAQLSGSGRTRSRAGAEPAQGGSARLRALEGDEAGRGHLVGRAVGPRAARLAHRVLGDGRARPRADVRDPRRRARSRLPAPRERARPVARARTARSRGSGCTTGC